MDFQDYVTFANEHPVCYLATSEGDQPRVRALMMWYADDTGFYFQSQSVKALCKQLEKNQNVEVIFHAPISRLISYSLRSVIFDHPSPTSL